MRKTAKQKRREALFTWVRDQYTNLDAPQMTGAMSCEALPNDQTPFHFWKAIVEFRRLRTDARVAACRVYLRNRS